MAKFHSLLPLILLLVVVVILAIIGFIAYSIFQDISKTTRSKMERKNVTFTKDGMKVGVKELKDEDYVGRSRSVMVNVWNHTSFPAYKSRLWNMTAPTSWTTNGERQNEAEKKKPHSN